MANDSFTHEAMTHQTSDGGTALRYEDKREGFVESDEELAPEGVDGAFVVACLDFEKLRSTLQGSQENLWVTSSTFA